MFKNIMPNLSLLNNYDTNKNYPFTIQQKGFDYDNDMMKIIKDRSNCDYYNHFNSINNFSLSNSPFISSIPVPSNNNDIVFSGKERASRLLFQLFPKLTPQKNLNLFENIPAVQSMVLYSQGKIPDKSQSSQDQNNNDTPKPSIIQAEEIKTVARPPKRQHISSKEDKTVSSLDSTTSSEEKPLVKKSSICDIDRIEMTIQNLTSKKVHRGKRKVCNRCATYKSRCIRLTLDGPCQRCIKHCEECTFSEQRKRGRTYKFNFVNDDGNKSESTSD